MTRQYQRLPLVSVEPVNRLPVGLLGENRNKQTKQPKNKPASGVSRALPRVIGPYRERSRTGEIAVTGSLFTGLSLSRAYRLLSP